MFVLQHCGDSIYVELNTEHKNVIDFLIGQFLSNYSLIKLYKIRGNPKGGGGDACQALVPKLVLQYHTSSLSLYSRKFMLCTLRSTFWDTACFNNLQTAGLVPKLYFTKYSTSIFDHMSSERVFAIAVRA